jgi:hypothetical protein
MGDGKSAIQQSVVDGQQFMVQEERREGVFGSQENVIGSNGKRPPSLFRGPSFQYSVTPASIHQVKIAAAVIPLHPVSSSSAPYSMILTAVPGLTFS